MRKLFHFDALSWPTHAGFAAARPSSRSSRQTAQMAFTNQFTLSLELTRLAPVASLSQGAAKAIIKFARDLQNSGSDIVVEEDLVEIFGRCRIATELDASFRTVVAGSTSTTSLWEGIMLQAGDGPTLARALKEPPYFAMLVQLSLLTWCFNSHQLASRMAAAMTNRLEDAPANSNVNAPSRDGILGVLRACENQTAAFDWNLLLHAVAHILECPVERSVENLSSIILQGGLDMFPMVQTLPEDRAVYIQIPWNNKVRGIGICFLVVWAHHVLDLTVLVKENPKRQYGLNKDVRFGKHTSPQVTIEENDQIEEAVISLLDPLSDHEELLTLREDPCSTFEWLALAERVHARGWGTALITETLSDIDLPKSQHSLVLRDLQQVSCAFAHLVASSLRRDDSGSQPVKKGGDYRAADFLRLTSNIPHTTESLKIHKAAECLFPDTHLSEKEIRVWISAFSAKPLNPPELPLPITVESILRNNGSSDLQIHDRWDQLCTSLRRVCVFLLAFAHIRNTGDWDSMTFSGRAARQLDEHHLMEQLEDWNGRDSIYVRDDVWMQALAIPFVGQSQHVWSLPWDRLCLMSDRGWSIWLPNFADTDPEYVVPGDVCIGRGSPCRRGTWKDGIMDAMGGPNLMNTEPAVAEEAGQQASLRCAEKVSVEKPICGENGEYFVVGARLRRHGQVPKHEKIIHVGYRWLSTVLWSVRLTNSCRHREKKKDMTLTLPVTFVTLEGFGACLPMTDASNYVCLTATNLGARWFAVATFTGQDPADLDDPDGAYLRLFLRRQDCCFSCAIEQVSVVPGCTALIL